jgi:hypothetical protein
VRVQQARRRRFLLVSKRHVLARFFSRQFIATGGLPEINVGNVGVALAVLSGLLGSFSMLFNFPSILKLIQTL